MAAPVLHQAIVESLGMAIVDAEIDTGSAVTLDDVMARFDASRTVAREAVRVLETLGMVAMKRRIGNVVLPRSMWRVMDPRIIRWRLAGSMRDVELDELMQLRAGIEPVAARLSASAAADDVGPRMIELADRMIALGEEGLGDTQEFLAIDLEFHQLLTASSGNAHVIAFSDTLSTLLTERNRLGLLDGHPDRRSMACHRAVAEAIATHDPRGAELACRELVDIVHDEVLEPGREPAAEGGAAG